MKRGSITLYLCMTLLVMLALIFAGLSSARISARRVVLAAGAEESLYSVFAGYDRDLFDKYGLLFLDASYGGSEADYALVRKEILACAEPVIMPDQQSLMGKNLCGLSLNDRDTAITGYVLASDEGGTAFRRQVCEQMREQLGEVGLALLKNRLQDEQETQNSTSQQRDRIDSSTAEEYYRADKEAGRVREASANDPLPDDPSEAVSSVRRRWGILALVVPSSHNISAGKAEIADFPSHRTLQTGMSMVPSADEGGDAEVKLLLQEFLMQNFPSYTDGETGDGLLYQVEYAIGGKKSDEENLRVTARKLLWLREAANLVYLMKTPDKRALCENTAEAICTILLIPEMAPVLAFAIETGWAYAESVLDVQELLDGGKIALIKDDASWQLDYGALASFTRGRYRHSSEHGLNYEEYLRLLLLTRSSESVTNALMDLTEYNIRQEDGRKNFRIDSCVDALRAEIVADAGGVSYTCSRSYGYDMILGLRS